MKFKNESYKKGALCSSSLSVVAKMFAFAQNLVIAYFIGANVSTDIFFYLFNITLLTGSLGQNLCFSVLIPHVTKLRSQDLKFKEVGYINAFVTSTIIFGLVVFLIVVLWGPSILNSITFFSPHDVKLNIYILYLLTPISMIYIVNIMYTELLVSYKYFSFPIIVNLVHNIFIALFVFLFHKSIGIGAAVIGLGIATVLNLCWLLLFMKRHIFWNFKIVKFAYLKETRRDSTFIFVNQIVGLCTAQFPLFLLSQLHPGVITIITYSTKLTQFPMSIINQFLSVYQIKLNELVTTDMYKHLKELFMQFVRILVVITFLGVIVLFVMKDVIINIFYGYGQMDERSITFLMVIFGIMVLSIPFNTVSMASAKLLFATRRIQYFASASVIINISMCIVYYFFISNNGGIGYAQVYVLNELLMCFSLLFFSWKTITRLSPNNNLL